jgi:long-chain acyl-CoA synthetase
LLILPLDHSFAHTCGIYTFMKLGASIATVQVGDTPLQTLKNVKTNIQEIKPHVLLSVPALAKNFRKGIEDGIKKQGMTKLFNYAMDLAYKYNKEGFNKGAGLKFWVKPQLWLFDKIMFSKIRQFFGGELEFFVGGGALLDIELQRFYYALGIPMFQGYGLSEATPVISTNAAKKHKLGSSGAILKGIDLKICDMDGEELPQGESGEIVIKGENVMLGYYKNDKDTADTIKGEWLHTGDMGYVDSDGFLYVLGRYKSLLISGDGEKYSPEQIEESFNEECKYIDQSMLHNNQNPFTIGLIVPNKSALVSAIRAEKIDLKSDQAIEYALDLVKSEIDNYKVGGKFAGRFPERWLPSTYSVLSVQFTEQNKFLNSTLKMVRRTITEAYKDRIEFLYTPEAKNHLNETNKTEMKSLLNS